MPGPTLAYEVVDVFTSVPYAGNQLAVVLDADGLSTAQLQALATEFGYSETCFPVPPPPGATYGLRIFTPATEIPFAGHPSVGAATVLHRLGRIAAGPNVQACGAGLLPVEVGDGWAALTGGTPTLGEALDEAPVLAAVGLEGPAMSPPRVAGMGLPFLYLLVEPAALALVEPDLRAIAALPSTGVAVVAFDGAVARARVFPAGAGVAEDPATGSAALGLGVFLVASGAFAGGAYDVVQGVEMGRPSSLRCRVEVMDGAVVSGVVTGDAVPVMRGEVRVP